MQTIDQALDKLSKSKFRSSFYLNKIQIDYINNKGLDIIRSHAKEIIKKNLASAYPKNDGKQTPMKNHPVFIAQHATATCCRQCLNKWYHVEAGVELTEVQQEKIVNLIMAWIERQL